MQPLVKRAKKVIKLCEREFGSELPTDADEEPLSSDDDPDIDEEDEGIWWR